MKFRLESLGRSLLEESCIFEVPAELFIEFPYVGQSKVVARLQSDRNLTEADCAVSLTYLSAGQNILLERVVWPRLAKHATINPSAVVAKRMGASAATTIEVGVESVVGAASIAVRLRRISSAPVFVRRDTIRIAKNRKPETFAPDCIVLPVSEQSRLRYLATCKPGRHILSSRFSIGAKGLMLTMSPLRWSGAEIKKLIGNIAVLDSRNVGAIAIPRARRLDRPDRFSKTIQLPERAQFIVGELYPVSEKDLCFYDIYSFRVRCSRENVGLPIGVNVFEHVALGLHQAALARSREDFIMLMQQD